MTLHSWHRFVPEHIPDHFARCPINRKQSPLIRAIFVDGFDVAVKSDLQFFVTPTNGRGDVDAITEINW